MLCEVYTTDAEINLGIHAAFSFGDVGCRVLDLGFRILGFKV